MGDVLGADRHFFVLDVELALFELEQFLEYIPGCIEEVVDFGLVRGREVTCCSHDIICHGITYVLWVACRRPPSPLPLGAAKLVFPCAVRTGSGATVMVSAGTGA